MTFYGEIYIIFKMAGDWNIFRFGNVLLGWLEHVKKERNGIYLAHYPGNMIACGN
jgi:hypothetical protein